MNICSQLSRARPREWNSGSRGSSVYPFQEQLQCSISLSPVEECQLPTPLSLPVVFILADPVGVRWDVAVVSICNSPMTLSIFHMFMGHLYVFFREMSIPVLCLFFNWVIFVFIVELK